MLHEFVVDLNLIAKATVLDYRTPSPTLLHDSHKHVLPASTSKVPVLWFILATVFIYIVPTCLNGTCDFLTTTYAT